MTTVIILQIFILMAAIILHECAHGWMAYRLGDPTAKEAGRLTLNPIKHVDPVGTVLLPGFLFFLNFLGTPIPILGWAKPVPVNFRRLQNPKSDMVWVGLAGPGVNIFLAWAASLVLKLDVSSFVRESIYFAIHINLLLAVFNMMPIPPLDGSRLVAGFLPDSLAAAYLRLEPFGILIVMVLLSMGALGLIIMPIVDYLSFLLGVSHW